jgi:predicted dehydrogenase
VIDRKDIGAVVIATPDHWHAIPTVWAMKAGKHVYCEKPLAHSVHEIRVMMKTAADKKLVTQMGTQIHAEDNYRRVVEIVQSGAIGPVRRVQVWCQKQPDTRRLNHKGPIRQGLDYEMWVGPAPMRPYDPAFLPFHWRWFWDFGGGILADMACHYMDLAHWALDLRTPTTVEATGRKINPGDHDVPDILQADFQHAARGDQPAVLVSWYSGTQGPKLDEKQPAFHGFPNGVLFEGDKGQLLADYGRYVLLPEKEFRVLTPPKQSIPKSIGHHREWLDAIRTGKATTCNFAYSGALAETVLLGNVAFRSGKKITWDEKAGKTDSAEADKWLRR